MYDSKFHLLFYIYFRIGVNILKYISLNSSITMLKSTDLAIPCLVNKNKRNLTILETLLITI